MARCIRFTAVSRFIAFSLIGYMTIAVAPATFAATPLPGAPNCPVFPADNVWNTDISNLPVDAHSAAWLTSMDSATTFLHPDFGPSDDPSAPYGMPYTVIAPGQPFVNVSFQYADESDPGPYPFGSNTPIEGGQSSTGDRHAIMVDPSTCTLYELYDATYRPDGPTAGSGAIWNLRSDALRPAGWTSADAAGLPILPGLVRYDEMESGAITHAIRMTAATTDTSYLWPARHEAGAQSNPNLPPMGARFRLKASFDIATYSPQAQVVLRAMQHYGLILADNGSDWYFGGTADSSWPLSLVDELKTIPASAFEAVDESSLMISPDSGQARQPSSSAPAPVPSPIASSTIAPNDSSDSPSSDTSTSVVPPTTTTTAARSRSMAPVRKHSSAVGREHQALGRLGTSSGSGDSGNLWPVVASVVGAVTILGAGWLGRNRLRRRRS